MRDGSQDVETKCLSITAAKQSIWLRCSGQDVVSWLKSGRNAIFWTKQARVSTSLFLILYNHKISYHFISSNAASDTDIEKNTERLHATKGFSQIVSVDTKVLAATSVCEVLLQTLMERVNLMGVGWKLVTKTHCFGFVPVMHRTVRAVRDMHAHATDRRRVPLNSWR